MKKIILLFIFFLNFTIYQQYGKINIGLGNKVCAWGIELDPVDVWGDDWWPDDDDDDDDWWLPGDDQGDGSDDDYWWEEEDYGNGNSSDDNPGWEEELKRIIKNLTTKDWEQNSMILVDLDRDGIIDGFFLNDAHGNVIFRSFTLGEVIIDGDETRINPSPLPIDEVNIPKIPRDNNFDIGESYKPVETATDDCNSESATKVKNMIDQLDKVKNINEAFNMLRKYVQTNSKDEIGITLNKDKVTLTFQQGEGNVTSMPVNRDTYIKVHVHPYYGFSAPSPNDVYLFLIQTRSYPNYEASLIIAADGTEYCMYIDDRDQANKIDWNKWFTTSDGYLANDDMADIEERYFTNIKGQGYSDQQAYEYALAQLIKEFAPGMKLYRRSNKKQDFKQMNPSKESNDIINPKICK